GRTLLFPAARSESEDAVKWLVESGLTVVVSDEQQSTPLHIAARYGGLEPLSFLIEKGAVVNSSDVTGTMPLHLAAERGHIVNVRHLVNKDADIFARDNQGAYPLHRSMKYGHWGPAQFFILRSVPVNALDNGKNTALHLAALGGYQRIVKLLLNYGADFTRKNILGKTPLVVAMDAMNERVLLPEMTHQERARYIGSRNTVFFLRGVVISEYANAVKRNDSGFIGQLIAAFPKYKDVMAYGKTPLYSAVQINCTDVARLLLEHGANPDYPAITDNGMTPLHVVAKNGDEDVARLLLEAGASVSIHNADGETPLDIANKYGRHAVAMLLQSVHPDVPE
ncbi:MAG: ankyrin repeat domain-containing protein, partial [Candidatus Hydrogenedentes bacterium]|nr:ankyrin repeat domain-containing protein [Candidatus Hydrogenedentota bacterium]